VDVPQLKKTPREKVDGVLLIDKPVGPSSQQVVGTLKRMFNADKVGHGGTLDPLASGLLIIGFGEATKFLQRHLDGDKRYLATLRFGAQTSTGDAEGEIIAQTDARPSREMFEAACERFVGEIEQLPPQYSALKIAGKPAYAYARAGEHAPLQSRRVRINSITLKNWTSEYAGIDVACGKGTYIRTLVEDIANAAGSLASLTGLRRLASGTLSLENGVQLEDLSQKSDAERLGRLMPPVVLLRGEPCLNLRLEEIQALASGKRIQSEHTPGQYVVMDNNTFCGLAVSDGRSLRVLRWLST
jgi:tRNA pseudouridine55 synthase